MTNLNVKRRTYLPFLIAALACATSHAATLTVTTTNDTGPGSLRQALDQANLDVILDTIAFNIPGGGVQTIAPATALPSINTPVVIDGYTQPGAAPNTLASGENAVLRIELSGALSAGNFNGLAFTGGGTNCTVRGLVINRFNDAIQFNHNNTTPSSNVVEGCFIGTDPTGMIGLLNFTGLRMFRGGGNRIGGVTPAARNLISRSHQAVLMAVGSAGNIIQGNFIGTDATGTNALPNNNGISIQSGANNCVIGGDSAAARNIIAGAGAGTGIECVSSAGHIIQGNFIGTDVTGTKVLGFVHSMFLSSSLNLIGGLTSTPGAPPGNVIAGGILNNIAVSPFVNDSVPSGNIIQGNLIGTDATGTVDLGNPGNGISLTTANNNTIGGSSAAAANVISGNNQRGIMIDAGVTNTIQGNRIGTDGSGARGLGNGGNGIEVLDRDNSIVGNVIAFNAGDGVVITSARATNNLISANSMFGNAGLGIDLEGLNGRDSNDAGDSDIGPNHLQNFPVITNVVVSLAGVTFQGLLASAPNTPYAVEFFLNPLCDSSASCEGQTFIGSTNLTTDATGTNFFSVTMSANVSCRFQASATATDTNRNTSELSVCRLATGIDTDGDRACDVEEVLAGTDFNDPASVFRMTGITRQGDDIHVTWQAGGGRTNMLQTIIDLAECVDFSDLPPQIALPGSGNLLLTNRLHIDGATNRSGFYRVRLVR